MSIVSLVMVLVRKRYFRVYCSQLLKNDYFRRTNTIMPDRQGFLSRTFTRNPASPGGGERNGNRSTGSKSKRGQRVSRMDISGPSDGRALGSVIPDKEDGIVGREMAESPTSFHRSRTSFRPSMEIQPANESMDGPTAQGSVEEANGGPKASAGIPHTRTIQLPADEPTQQFQARQRIRTQSRAMSLGLAVPPKTVQHPINVTMTMPSPLPRPDAAKHSGMGGFGTPLQWLPHLLPERAKISLQRRVSRPQLERQTTILTNARVQHNDEGEEDWSATLMSSMARWMPDTLTHLVVGRNSRFFSEELDDDDLEQIGGVEYRALRLLSYFIAAVGLLSLCQDRLLLMSQYIFLSQAIPFAIIAIYLSQVNSWDSAFQASLGTQANTVNKTWFSLFVTVSAYTGTGLK